MTLGPEGKKHLISNIPKELRISVFAWSEKEKKQTSVSSLIPKTELASSLRASRGSAVAQARGPCSQSTHIHPALLLTRRLQIQERKMCGRLYCHALKLDISGATEST